MLRYTCDGIGTNITPSGLGSTRAGIGRETTDIKIDGFRAGRGPRYQLRLLHDLVDDLDEGPLDILARLGADLAECGALRLGERLALLERHRAAARGHLVQLTPDL